MSKKPDCVALILKVGERTREDAKADAAFIVRAVNCHEELLQAAKDALEAMGFGPSNKKHLHDIENQLEQAIAKAEGK